VLHRKKLAAAAEHERDALKAHLVTEHTRLAGGVDRAMSIGVLDEVISPGETRRRLAETFGTTIAVTAAAEPVRVAWPGGQAQVPVWDVTAADPTGAGDAFFAGCLAACLVGADPVAAAREGAATALRFLEARG